MKSILVLALFGFFLLNAFSQSIKNNRFALAVEKVNSTQKKAFAFKPNKTLKIMTLDGMKYTSKNYSFSDKFIVTDLKDTILFENISKIQGQVYEDGERKVLGVLLTLVAMPLIFIAIGEGVEGDNMAFIASTPFIGMGYGGLRFIGPRRFRISKNCYIKVIENQKP